MFGGPGDDVNLWAPGDGSEVFIGGPGHDALIFGSTDRDAVADPATGVRLPTRNVCTIEDSPSPGYRYLVRFRNAAGNILATCACLRLNRCFCSQGGGVIAFADLTVPSPAFSVVTHSEVEHLNSLVASMIR